MACLTPEQVVQGTSARYGIVWDVRDHNIVPHEMVGNHSFVEASKNWKFDFGEGCVGRAYAKHQTLIVEDSETGESMFLRKNIAKKCGINAVVFVPQEDGSVLEIGFDRKLNELPQSWWMRNILGHYASDSNMKDSCEDIHRMRTPSPASFLNAESHSLRALARVALGIDRSLAMLPPAEHIDHLRSTDVDRQGHIKTKFAFDTNVIDEAYLRRAASPCPSDSSSDMSWESQEDDEDDFVEDSALDAQAETLKCGFDFGSTELPKPTIQLDLADHVSTPKLPSRPIQRFLKVGDVAPDNDQGQQKDAMCSVGSIGHPDSCGGACKFMKTQNGCKFGAVCDRCHLCFWTRSSERERTRRKQLESEKPQPDGADNLKNGLNNTLIALESYLGGRVASNQEESKKENFQNQRVNTGIDISSKELPKPTLQVELASYIPPKPSAASFQKPSLGETFAEPPAATDDALQKGYLKALESICSAGTVGHPYFCGGACKYFKSHKGCKVGAGCDRCHLCVWTRASERDLAQKKKISSLGSVGHPHFCAGACKYHTRKECKQGAACDRCHLCTWTRAGERVLVRQKQAEKQKLDASIGFPNAGGGWSNLDELNMLNMQGTVDYCYMSL